MLGLFIYFILSKSNQLFFNTPLVSNDTNEEDYEKVRRRSHSLRSRSTTAVDGSAETRLSRHSCKFFKGLTRRFDEYL